MSQQFNIAVFGATGAVGETMVEVLQERDFPMGDIY
jgi:aspartate-semialdehyde dehydrogenase